MVKMRSVHIQYLEEKKTENEMGKSGFYIEGDHVATGVIDQTVCELLIPNNVASKRATQRVEANFLTSSKREAITET